MFSNTLMPKRQGLISSHMAKREMPNDFVAASGGEQVFDATYFLKGSLAGGICCSITHGGLTPVDVVKTRIQLDSVKYNKGMMAGFKQIAAEEGTGALLTGLGPTVAGYFVQGTSAASALSPPPSFPPPAAGAPASRLAPYPHTRVLVGENARRGGAAKRRSGMRRQRCFG